MTDLTKEFQQHLLSSISLDKQFNFLILGDQRTGMSILGCQEALRLMLKEDLKKDVLHLINNKDVVLK